MVYCHVCGSHSFEKIHSVQLSIFVWKSSLITTLFRISIHIRLNHNNMLVPYITTVKLIILLCTQGTSSQPSRIPELRSQDTVTKKAEFGVYFTYPAQNFPPCDYTVMALILTLTSWIFNYYMTTIITGDKPNIFQKVQYM